MRRVTRIFVLVATAMLLAVVTVAQFQGIEVNAGPMKMAAGPAIFAWFYSPDVGPWTIRALSSTDNLQSYFAMPEYLRGHFSLGSHLLLLPWWLVVTVWAGSTGLVLRLTRQKKGPPNAFPVEVGAPAKEP